MNREELLTKLSAAQLAMFELHLYLDTHPDNDEAMMLYNGYEHKMKQLKKDYEKLYGPLTFCAADTAADWAASPWPWDVQGGKY